MELQPVPLSVNEPVRFVNGRTAICDGGKCATSRLVALNCLRIIVPAHTVPSVMFALDSLEVDRVSVFDLHILITIQLSDYPPPPLSISLRQEALTCTVHPFVI